MCCCMFEAAALQSHCSAGSLITIATAAIKRHCCLFGDRLEKYAATCYKWSKPVYISAEAMGMERRNVGSMSCTFPVCLFIYLFWQAATNKWTSEEHCCLILGQPGMLCHGRDSILPLTSQAIVKEWFRNIWIVIETSFQEIKTTLCRFQPDSRLLRCVVLQTALTDNLLIWCTAFVNAQGGEKRPSIPGHNASHWKRSASATSFLLTSFPAVMFRRPDGVFFFFPPCSPKRGKTSPPLVAFCVCRFWHARRRTTSNFQQ